MFVKNIKSIILILATTLVFYAFANLNFNYASGQIGIDIREGVMVYKGLDPQHKIWYSTFTNGNWSPVQPINGATTDISPALGHYYYAKPA